MKCSLPVHTAGYLFSAAFSSAAFSFKLSFVTSCLLVDAYDTDTILSLSSLSSPVCSPVRMMFPVADDSPDEQI